MQNLIIDAKRLYAEIEATAKVGGTLKGGINRLTLTEDDKTIRDWFKDECEKLGMSLVIDEVGNMFATRKGLRDCLPIAMGSHLDTQPTGGKYDGILGVLAGLEVIKTLNKADLTTNAPLMLINWANEEGSRFSPAMLGSGVYAGLFDKEYAYARTDRQGVTYGEALNAIGYRGDTKMGEPKFQAHFELHIEQGPLLEANNKQVGIVEGVQGIRWFEVTIKGRDAHAGSTPMANRSDALVTAAHLTLAVQKIAVKNQGVGTIGLIEAKPNSTNVIPGEVYLTVDFRNPLLEALDKQEQALMRKIKSLQGECEIEVKRIWASNPIPFDAKLIDCVLKAAEKAGLSTQTLFSGAGHDCANIARVLPATMIFVPSKDGLSHNEAEYTSLSECGHGAQVLLNAVLELDNQL